MGEEVTPGDVTPETPPSAGEDLTPTPEVTPDGAWFSEFTDDDKSFLATKGWDKEGKGPADVLKSYRSLEKMRGVAEDKLLVLPDFTNEADTKAFYAKMGVPETAEGYGTAAQDIAGRELDVTKLDAMSHSMNHTPAQHKTFMEEVTGFLNSSITEEMAAQTERDSVEKQELDKEWGTLAKDNYTAAAKAANRFGIDTPLMDKIQEGLGYRGTVELFTKIGRAFGEGKAPDADGAAEASPFGITPSVAKDRLENLKRDSAFRDKLFAGDTNAREEWDRLKKLAFQG